MQEPRRRGRVLAGVVAAAVLVGAGVIVATARSRGTVRVAAPAGRATRAVVAAPPIGGRFDYQLGGAYAPAADVRIVDRDREDPAATGRYSVCYLNAFQTQPEEAASWTGARASLLLRTSSGTRIEDPDWPGEYVLDISTSAKRRAIAAIVDGWIDGCARAGYRAIEPDNLDTFTRWPGRLTESDAIAYARLLAIHAHAKGLAIAQKNAADLGSKGKQEVGFDFAIAEECQVYRECGAYTAVYGRHVVEVEYTDNGRAAFATACHERGDQISVVLRDRDVVPRGRAAYRSEWCT